MTPFVSISITANDGQPSTFLADARPIRSGRATAINQCLVLRTTHGALVKNSQRMEGIRTEISTQMKQLAKTRANPFAARGGSSLHLLQTNGDHMREFDVLDKTRWQDLTPATSVGTGSNEAEKWDSEVIIQLDNARRLRIPVQKVAVTVEWPPDWETLKAGLSSTWGTQEAEYFMQEDEEEEDEEEVEGGGGRTRSRRKKNSTPSPCQMTAAGGGGTLASPENCACCSSPCQEGMGH
jgi:hypothetical protein